MAKTIKITPQKVEISHRTIIFTVLFLVLIWFLFQIRSILLELFVALLIMAILNPFVTRLSKYKIPRAISVLLVYLLLFGVIAFTVASIAPPLAEQSTIFASTLPDFMNRLGVSTVLSDQIVVQAISQIGTLPSQLAKVTISVFSNFLSVITILIFALYLLLARDKLEDQLGPFFGEKYKDKVGRTIDSLEYKLGGWVTAQAILMLIVGVATYIGLTLLGIPFALPLAVLAGLLEVVPYVGPILAAVPAVLIGFGLSPIMGFAVIALAFLIQQFENHVFVPKLMQKSIGINPVVTLLALAIGFRLAGIVGILVAIPTVITIEVFTKEFLLKSK